MLNLKDLSKIFDLNLIFEVTPSFQGVYLYSAIIYGLALIAAIALGVISRRKGQDIHKKLRTKFIYLLLFNSCAGLILVFFRWQSIPYLASRLTVWILWIATALWLLDIIWYWLITLPKEIAKKYEKERFEKYLPH